LFFPLVWHRKNSKYINFTENIFSKGDFYGKKRKIGPTKSEEEEINRMLRGKE